MGISFGPGGGGITKTELENQLASVHKRLDGLTRLSVLIGKKIGLTESEMKEALSGEKTEPGKGIW